MRLDRPDRYEMLNPEKGFPAHTLTKKEGIARNTRKICFALLLYYLLELQEALNPVDQTWRRRGKHLDLPIQLKI